MKLFIQDHTYAGATVVIAEDENQAAMMASQGQNSYYEKDRPWDHIQDCDKPFHVEIFGDR